MVFILATTEPARRPRHHALARASASTSGPWRPRCCPATLERVLVEEKIPFDPAALPPVVRAAAGSLRDALSLLDTAIAYGNGRLDADTAAALLGTTTPAEVRAFAAALLAHDSGAALEAVDRAAREGEDLHAFIRDVIETLRLVLVLKAAPTTKLADLTSTEGNELRTLGESVSLDEILYVLRALLDADELMRESPHPRVELEIATVRSHAPAGAARAGGRAAPRGRGGGPAARRRPHRRIGDPGAPAPAEHSRSAARRAGAGLQSRISAALGPARARSIPDR